jgi:hypothetical protein
MLKNVAVQFILLLSLLLLLYKYYIVNKIRHNTLIRCIV